ncbi:MAG: ABC transporter permease [Rhizobiaceae bacterium]|nr:ABC transporter permease [Rhizobiaceae bacterium]MCV0408137.1 ABC transporter permease [Rhizobiaceae bacterium]
MGAGVTRHVRGALGDIGDALARRDVAFMLGWRDIAQRYKRSRIGAFWLTINRAVLICALGLVFGTLFRRPMAEFLPYVGIGLIFWGYISGMISNGCQVFISASGMILQSRLPYFLHVMKMWWGETAVLAHNLAIYPVLMLIFLRNPGWAALLAIPGFVLLSANLIWIATVLGLVSARFRDLPQIIQNLVQVAFYLTPIMWMPDLLPDPTYVDLLNLNPFYHLLMVVKLPLLGQSPTIYNWLAVTLMAIVGWCFTLVFFGRFRARIPYWL